MTHDAAPAFLGARLVRHPSRGVRSSKRTFESRAIPMPQTGGSLIGADEKFHQGLVRIICRPHGVIGQIELIETLVPKGATRADRSHREAVRRRRGIGIKRWIVDTLPTWPKARA